MTKNLFLFQQNYLLGKCIITCQSPSSLVGAMSFSYGFDILWNPTNLSNSKFEILQVTKAFALGESQYGEVDYGPTRKER